MKKLLNALLAAILLSIAAISVTLAQTEQLTLRLSRDWGYGGFNNDIQGLFSMRVKGPADLIRVEYYIDGKKIGEVDQLPFNLQFTTDDYPLGFHTLSAIGYSKDGNEYRSIEIQENFVPKQSSTKVILPILGIILLAVLISTLAPLLLRRGKHLSLPLGSERTYGAGGGGICPNCHRPFALPFMSAHLGFSRLAVCPFCGKWGLVRLESIGKLREAEKAELESARIEKPVAITDEQKLAKEIDESKYQGL
jgi:hypothetical protein